MPLSKTLNRFYDLLAEHAGTGASTLRNHFFSIRDQIEMLEHSHAMLKKSHAKLKNEYKALKDEIADIQKENTDLEVQLAYFNGSKFELSSEAVQILQYLFNEDQFHSPKDLAVFFEWQVGVAKIHCAKLIELKLVRVRRQAIRDHREPSIEIAGNDAGRAYIADNKLMWQDPKND